MTYTQQRRSLANHIRNADDPAIAFKVGGLDVLAAMDKVRAHDETTQDSGSGGSGFSDMSALENETDEFGRRLLQHQRDVQRLNKAVHPSQQAFRKARPRPRLADRLGYEDLQNGVADGQDHERPGSAGSSGSDPPVNVPTQWGRKAKTQPDWLRNAHMGTAGEAPLVDGQREDDGRKQDEDAIIPHRTVYTGDEDWTAVGEEPFQSIEDTPPSMRRKRVVSSPSSMRHMNTTMGPTLESDDQDFTAASLLASTPAVNRRDRKIDELTRREIETIERRGVTKRTLEQIIEQSAITITETRPSTAPAGETVRATRRRRSLIANKENVAPNGDVNATYKGTETVGLVNRTAQAVTFKNAQRPAHVRSDSLNLLKRIARVSSMSPSSAKSSAERDVVEKRTKSEPLIDSGPLSAKSTNSDYISGDRPSGQPSEDEQPLYGTPEAGQQEPDEDDEEGEAALTANRQAPDIDVTPAPHEAHEAPLDAKTPVVTGAWVDTPAPQIDIRPLLTATDSTFVRAFGSPSGAAALEIRDDPLEDSGRRIHSEPLQAKSALADILKEAKSASEPQFGDATIQSLEDILTPDLDPTDLTLPVDVGEVAQEGVDAIDADQPLTQAERDRRQEDLAMEAMNKHLRAARTSIKDANRGLRRVENRIETAQTVPPAASASSNATGPAPLPRPTISENGKTVCDACGGTYYGSVWKALWTEFRSCFYSWDPPPSSRLRFTWLGLMCLSTLAWYLLESVLCAYYCHRLYGSSMVGYGVDMNAPRFPFVIPTLFFRPFKFIWEPASETLGWCSGLLFHSLFGDNAVSSDPPVAKPAHGTTIRKAFTNTLSSTWAQTATANIAAASTRVVGSVVDTLDEAGSMWDDEFLS
ncbi:hypothetical protein LTR36_000576 [Oleoguttula mirabilis]|uniref:Uncharacterized protein n=1 Tax=Oleoguttula mirabilis TaxID=1507867 RepID=A0AAV9JPU0_9PEZI|nr:hypothetical protein LTR36_000576 [Oleoguttula mirabilis]